MKLYATLDNSNVCIGISDAPNEYEVPSWDYIGYTYQDGEWIAPQQEPSQLDRIESTLDDADTIQAELLLNQANADLDTELILETLAEILLNQQEV